MWNCQGAGNNKFLATAKDLICVHKIQVFAVVEPRVSGDQATKIIKKFGFANHVRAEAQGFSGGIWLLWHDASFTMEVEQIDPRFIHVQIGERGNRIWGLTVVYAKPDELAKAQLRSQLEQMVTTMMDPWMVIGDFNDIASQDEKKGGAPINVAKCI